jgi:hypothetical protein
MKLTGLLGPALMLAALPAAAIPATPATASKPVWVTGGPSCLHERFKPKQIVIACADGTDVLKGLKWSTWSATRATGTGTDYVVTCSPDCASGHRTAYPVSVTLTQPRSCKRQAHPVFSRAMLKFGKTHPGLLSAESDRLSCPA